MREGVLDLFHRGRVPGEQHGAVADEPPDPVELRRVRADARHAEKLVEEHRLVEDADDGAVLGGDVVEVVGAAHAAGARHVLHHDVRIAGKMCAKVALPEAAHRCRSRPRSSRRR